MLKDTMTTAKLEAYCDQNVAIYLMNGIKLTGYLSTFDAVGLTLDNHNGSQLIFRTAIASIMPKEVSQF